MVQIHMQLSVDGSIADPGSEFFYTGSRVKKASDPGSATKNLTIYGITTNFVPKL
jgi:hypothetical protein